MRRRCGPFCAKTRTSCRKVDFRVNTLYGEKVVLRILDASADLVGIDHLGFEPEQKSVFLSAIQKPCGMVLVTGPTGSGKTVSLYTALDILNRGASSSRSAANGRRDPRRRRRSRSRPPRRDTWCSTLHTNDAPQSLTRLANMGIAPYNIASSVHLTWPSVWHGGFALTAGSPSGSRETLLEAGFGATAIEAEPTLYRAVGCERCTNGYRGRVGIFRRCRSPRRWDA